MRWIDSRVELVEPVDASAILGKLELALRNCYKSEDKIEEGSAERIIRSCIARGHESPMEHAIITYRVICDRGVSHEWVRHRIASYSQESTRYCNYTKGKFGSELTFIYPFWYKEVPPIDKFMYKDLTENQKQKLNWWSLLNTSCRDIETHYNMLIQDGAPAEVARAILPNCLKTEIVCTMNIRELRNFFKLRTTKFAHPDIRKLAIELLSLLRQNGLSVLFEDIVVEEN